MTDLFVIANQQCPERWQIYQRLQALDIECCCSGYQSLRVQVASPSSLVQIWSVMRQFCGSIASQRHWLEQCWVVEFERMHPTQRISEQRRD